ncbi:hypothetical protein, partial [Paenibacillus albiflavus]|uniref:hypothetical protein n=1 Tax=Paenibacillus albiflavus TaxID=2545760 RepID=UPI001A9CF5A4
MRRELASRFSDGRIKCGNQSTDISVPTVEVDCCLRAEKFSQKMGLAESRHINTRDVIGNQ